MIQLILFILVCMFFSFSYENPINSSDLSIQQEEQCANKVGLNLDNFINVTEKQLTCFFACVGEEKGVITNDKYDGEKYAEQFVQIYTFEYYDKANDKNSPNNKNLEEKMKQWKTQRDNVVDAIKVCAIEVGEDKDHCNLAKTMFKCKRAKLREKKV